MHSWHLFKQMKNILLITFVIITAIASAQNVVQQAFEQSYVNEKNSEYEKAINDLNKVYSDKSYEINLRLGWLNYQKGSFEKSVNYYTKAIAIYPYSEEAKFGLILPKIAIADWVAVVSAYKQILIISPNNTTANYRLGLIYYNQGKFAQAYPMFEKVVNLYPFDYDGLLMYAWTLLQIGKSNESRILFDKVLLNNPKDESALEGIRILEKK